MKNKCNGNRNQSSFNLKNRLALRLLCEELKKWQNIRHDTDDLLEKQQQSECKKRQGNGKTLISCTNRPSFDHLKEDIAQTMKYKFGIQKLHEKKKTFFKQRKTAILHSILEYKVIMWKTCKIGLVFLPKCRMSR